MAFEKVNLNLIPDYTPKNMWLRISGTGLFLNEPSVVSIKGKVRDLELNYTIELDPETKDIRFVRDPLGDIKFSLRTTKVSADYYNMKLSHYIFKFLGVEPGSYRLPITEINNNGDLLVVSRRITKSRRSR